MEKQISIIVLANPECIQNTCVLMILGLHDMLIGLLEIPAPQSLLNCLVGDSQTVDKTSALPLLIELFMTRALLGKVLKDIEQTNTK